MLEIAGGIIIAIAILGALIVAVAAGIPFVLLCGVGLAFFFFGLKSVLTFLFIIIIPIAIGIVGIVGFINFLDRLQSPSKPNKEEHTEKVGTIEQIGGMRNWLIDSFRRLVPSFTLNQRITKQRYLDVDRPLILKQAAEDRVLRKVNHENLQKRRQEDLLIQRKKEFELYKEAQIRKHQRKIVSVVEKLKRAFRSQPNVAFRILEDASYIRTHDKENVFSSYMMFSTAIHKDYFKIPDPEITVSRDGYKNTANYEQWVIYIKYKLKDLRSGEIILDERDLNVFKKALQSQIIRDIAKIQI